MTTNEWSTFFDGHAPVYDDNSFTHNTLVEVDFLVEELNLAAGSSILDVGCGSGRHSVELARRGYIVTGIDISAGMLAQARQRADAAQVAVTWVQANATAFALPQPVAAAICLCEGAFGLLGGQDDAIGQPLAILRCVTQALKPGAPCLFTVLNSYRAIRSFSQADVERGTFDPLTLTEITDPAAIGAGDQPDALPLRERSFTPTEMVLLFDLAGLEVLHIWGGTAGAWNRATIHLDEMEIMVVGRKRREEKP